MVSSVLGRARTATTMQIYRHVDDLARNQALTGLNDLLTAEGRLGVGRGSCGPERRV